MDEQKGSPVVAGRLDKVEVSVERGQPGATRRSESQAVIFDIESPLGEELLENLSGEFGVNVSTELLVEVLEPAELIVVATFPAYEGVEPLLENPLWQRLLGVKNGAVGEVHVDGCGARTPPSPASKISRCPFGGPADG